MVLFEGKYVFEASLINYCDETIIVERKKKHKEMGDGTPTRRSSRAPSTSQTNQLRSRVASSHLKPKQKTYVAGRQIHRNLKIEQVSPRKNNNHYEQKDGTLKIKRYNEP